MNQQKYENLAPSKNSLNTQSKYMKYLRMLIEQPIAVGNVLESFTTAFNLETAVGKQLDTIGALVGLSRVLKYLPSDGSSREMTDEEYRMILRLRIAMNSWDGTNQGIVDITNLISTDAYTFSFQEDDNGFELLFDFEGEFPTRMADILNATDALPIPGGIGHTIVVETGEFEMNVLMDFDVTGMEYNFKCTLR